MNRLVLSLLALVPLALILGLPRPAPAASPANAPLIDAASRGDIPAVRSLLAQGQDVDTRDDDGNTPLMAALDNGVKPMSQAFRPGLSDTAYVGMVRFLLAHGADVNARNHAGMTPLMINLCNGHADGVPLLIARGAEVNTSNGTGAAPLMYAISDARSETDQVPLILLLLKHGASPNASNTKGHTALRLAAAEARPAVVRLLLTHGAVDGGAAAADAALLGRTDNMRVLIQNVKDKTERRRRATLALKSAITQGSYEATKPVIKYLVEQRADLEVKDGRGWTPFMTEVYEGQRDMVDFLLDHGANINAADDQGETALWRARQSLIDPPKPSDSDHEKELRRVAFHVLDRGADVNAANHYGQTLTYFAAETGDLPALNFWAGHGGDLNKAEGYGQSPLAVALVSRHNAAASFLIRHGADVNSKNKAGLMPLHFALSALTEALKAGEPDVVFDLITRGADVNAPGHLNSPPLETMMWSRPVPPPVGCTLAEKARFDQVNAESLSDMRLLIARGADVNNWNKWTGLTLLQVATLRKDADAVRILTDAGEKK